MYCIRYTLNVNTSEDGNRKLKNSAGVGEGCAAVNERIMKTVDVVQHVGKRLGTVVELPLHSKNGNRSCNFHIYLIITKKK